MRQNTELCVREDKGGFCSIEQTLNIKREALTPEQDQKLWLQRDYEALLSQYSTNSQDEFMTSVKYGEVSVIETDEIQAYSYSDQLGLVKV